DLAELLALDDAVDGPVLLADEACELHGLLLLGTNGPRGEGNGGDGGQSQEDAVDHGSLAKSAPAGHPVAGSPRGLRSSLVSSALAALSSGKVSFFGRTSARGRGDGGSLAIQVAAQELQRGAVGLLHLAPVAPGQAVLGLRDADEGVFDVVALQL